MTSFFSHRPQISNFPPISVHFPLYRENYYFPPYFGQFPPCFRQIHLFFYILYVYFVSPYFYHDAFMHHPMHVLDAPDCNYYCGKNMRIRGASTVGGKSRLGLDRRSICLLQNKLFIRNFNMWWSIWDKQLSRLDRNDKYNLTRMSANTLSCSKDSPAPSHAATPSSGRIPLTEISCFYKASKAWMVQRRGTMEQD